MACSYQRLNLLQDSARECYVSPKAEQSIRQLRESIVHSFFSREHSPQTTKQVMVKLLELYRLSFQVFRGLRWNYLQDYIPVRNMHTWTPTPTTKLNRPETITHILKSKHRRSNSDLHICRSCFSLIGKNVEVDNFRCMTHCIPDSRFLILG